MLVNVQVNKLLCFVGDVVLLQVAVHVEGPAQTLPCVAGRVLVQVYVAVEDLVQGLLTAHIDHVVVLCVEVDNAKLASLLSQSADS